MSDILDGIALAINAFRREGLDAPAAILLSSHNDGMRFLSALRQQHTWSAMVGSDGLGKPIEMADGSVYMEVQVMGLAVRWPANRIANPDGSWSLV